MTEHKAHMITGAIFVRMPCSIIVAMLMPMARAAEAEVELTDDEWLNVLAVINEFLDRVAQEEIAKIKPIMSSDELMAMTRDKGDEDPDKGLGLLDHMPERN